MAVMGEDTSTLYRRQRYHGVFAVLFGITSSEIAYHTVPRVITDNVAVIGYYFGRYWI